MLCTLIPDHTQKRCDCSTFGIGQRAVKQADINCPSEMFREIDQSSVKNVCVHANDVTWSHRNAFLETFYELTSQLNLYTC